MTGYTQLAGSEYAPVVSPYVLPKGCDLYVTLRGAQGLKSEADSDTFATVTSGSLRFQTRLVRKSNAPEWNEVFIFTLEDLLHYDQKVTFEVWWERRWAADTLLGQADLNVAALELAHPGIVLQRTLQLQVYDRSGTPKLGEHGVLSVSISVLYTAPDAGMVSEVRAGKLEKQYWMIINGAEAGAEGAQRAVEVPMEASSAPMMVRPRVTVAGTSSIAPCITHSAAGTLYEQPCVSYLRLTLQKATGLRNLASSHHRGGTGPAAGRSAATRNSSIRQRTAGVVVKGRELAQQIGQRVVGMEAVNKTSEFFTRLRSQRKSDDKGEGGTATGGITIRSFWAAARDTIRSGPSTHTPAPPAAAPAADAVLVSESAMAEEAVETVETVETVEGWVDTQGATEAPHAQVAVEADGLDSMESEHSIAEMVNHKLESIGFHVTDTPGGNYCYVKFLFDGQTCVSNIAPHAEGIATWNQSLLFAAMRPLRNSPVDVEVYMCPERKSRGKLACRFSIPLFELLGEGGEMPTATDVPSFPPRTFTSQTPDGHTMEVQLKLEVVDGDARPARYRLPLCAGSRDVLWLEAPEEEDSAAATNGEEAEMLSPATSSPPSRSSFTAPTRVVSTSSPATAPGTPSTTATTAGPDPGSATSLGAVTRTPSAASVGSVPGAAPVEAAAAAAAAGVPVQPAGTLGQLLLTIHNFEVDKASECFAVFHCGSYWGSSTSVNVSSGAHDWEIRLPVQDPSEILMVALFRGENKVGEKKAKRGLFYDNCRMVGKLRVRLSTLLPSRICKCRLPLISERTERKGVSIAGWANLSLKVHYYDVVKYLRSYLLPMIHKPAIQLCLALDVKAEDLVQQANKISMRWLHDCCPPIPAKVGRRVVDNGRMEFSLHRTKQNWLRISVMMARIKPIRTWLERVASWHNPLVSSAMVTGIVLLGIYPSKVVAMLFFLAVLQLLLYRVRLNTFGLPPAMMEDLLPPQAARPEEPTPHLQPMDPYSVLKAQYDALVTFMMRVQNTLDTIATNVERVQMLLTWQDPVASMLFCGVLLGAGIGVWLLSLRVIFCFALAWAFRPPFLRQSFPAPPANFIAHLPSNSDLMM